MERRQAKAKKDKDRPKRRPRPADRRPADRRPADRRPADRSPLKLGVYWAAGCGGCDLAVLEIHEKVLGLLEAVELVFWPCLVDVKYADLEGMPAGHIDLCLFNGTLRTEENLRLARLLREKARVLVAYGACAASGGIPALGNAVPTEAILARAFATESTVNPRHKLPRPGPRPRRPGAGLPALLPKALALHQVVPVDYVMPGCPPTADQTWAVLQAVIGGELPPPGSLIGAGQRAVCDECPLTRRDVKVKGFRRRHLFRPEPGWCLLEQGVVCLGPATRSGCGAQCPSASMPCRGCYGPSAAGADVGARMTSVLSAMLDSEDPGQIESAMSEVVDPLGTFYGFTLATTGWSGARDGR